MLCWSCFKEKELTDFGTQNIKGIIYTRRHCKVCLALDSKKRRNYKRKCSWYKEKQCLRFKNYIENLSSDKKEELRKARRIREKSQRLMISTDYIRHLLFSKESLKLRSSDIPLDLINFHQAKLIYHRGLQWEKTMLH